MSDICFYSKIYSSSCLDQCGILRIFLITSKLFHPRKYRILSSESKKRKEKYLLQAVSLARVEAEKAFYFGLAFSSAVVRNNYCKCSDYNPRISWTFLTICCVTSITEETVKNMAPSQENLPYSEKDRVCPAEISNCVLNLPCEYCVLRSIKAGEHPEASS